MTLKRLPIFVALLAFLLFRMPALHAQDCTSEIEPNDQPAQATAISGAGCMNGTLKEGDQDLYKWTVSEADAAQTWKLTLQEVSTDVTGIQLLLLRVTFADNGSDVLESRKLYQSSLNDGASGESEPLLLLPGTYFLGVSAAGGEGNYQFALDTLQTMSTASDANSSNEAPSPLPAPDTENKMIFSGDLQGVDDYFAWTVSESDANQRWRISALLPLGEDAYLYLNDAKGNQLDYQEVAENGTIEMGSLGLAAGNYLVRIASGRDHSVRYQVEIQPDGSRDPNHEEESNDDVQHAWNLDPGQLMEGSFPTGHYDIDFYKLRVDAAFSSKQWQLSATPSVEANFELCLLNDQSLQLQCRENDAPILTDLSLVPADYYVTIRSLDRIAAEYTLQYEELGDAALDRESEPNDDIAHASAIVSENTIQGRFVGSEDDYYRFTVTGKSQLWRVQATGSNLSVLSYLEVDGQELSRIDGNHETRMRLDDLYLLPGDHYVRLHGEDSDYTLRILPVGPPAESVKMPPGIVDSGTADSETVVNAGVTEREPNNAPDRAEKLPFDTPRSGRLSNTSDHDVYRFYLAGSEHVRFVLVQPVGGLLYFDVDNLFFNANRPDGSPIIYENVLGPGDHFLNIDAPKPSDEIYYLLLQRLNVLDLPVDNEAINNQRATAPIIPPALTVSGTVNQAEDYQDWVRLPELNRAATITVSLTPSMTLDLRSGEDSIYPLNQDREHGVYSFDLTVGQPAFVGISGNGAYTLTVSLGDGASMQVEPQPLPVSLLLVSANDSIAAFWENGQQINLSLTLTNSSNNALDLALSAVSSDFAWQLAAGADQTITVPARQTIQIPLAVSVLPEVGSVLPARFAVRVQDKNGAFATTTLDLPASCGTLPVNPDGTLTTAGALRGGLNVAWRGLGSQPVNDQSNDHIFELFDEISSPGFGWAGKPDDYLTVDLAGDDAIPVAGVILNAFGRIDTIHQLRHFEVLLSEDGLNFSSVYIGELEQNPIDQAIVFAQAIPARFAQLRLIDNWRGDGEIGIGEFKVIASQEYKLSNAVNLLDPLHGGHVVSGLPLLSNLQQLVTPEAEQPFANAGESPVSAEWVVGFHNDRVAQITTLHWRNWEGSVPAQRFSRVELQVSTQSPIGPWQPLSTWTLDPTSIETQTLTLDAPVWARFVRFVAEPPADPHTYLYPDQIAIDETPIDTTYRSILAEWGGYRPQAIFEQMQQIHPLASQINEVEPNDNRETAQAIGAREPIKGTVQVNGDGDWFKLSVPADANTLSIGLGGEPTVGVDFELLDNIGTPITNSATITGGVLTIQAVVSPGEYYLHVLDPKRSIVFSWDTSGSVGPYITQIYQSMASFTEGIDPAYEVVNLLPFGDPGRFLLEDFSGDPIQAQQAFNDYPHGESSSSVELNLLAASEKLAVRTGTRAIVLMTDAESAINSYSYTDQLWQSLNTVRPRIFSFEISSDGNLYAQDLMQDWAMVNNGYYENMSTIGSFEQGFERATCLLRRPTAYTLNVRYSNEAPAAPGSLSVVGKANPQGQPRQVIGGGAVELILDASGSMLQRIKGVTKIEIARSVLINLTSNVLPAAAPIALRVFGDKEAGSCRSDLEIPLQPLDAATVNQIIAGINAKNLAKTPIADSLRQVAQDLAGASEQKVVILVTDGEETCGGNPEQEITALRAAGIDVRINIVGFDVNDDALKATFQRWASEGGGDYFNASNAAELYNAVSAALRAPFRVLDANGTEVATGVVNGEQVSLPAGTYTVEVLSEPVQKVAVTVGGGESVMLEVGEV